MAKPWGRGFAGEPEDADSDGQDAEQEDDPRVVPAVHDDSAVEGETAGGQHQDTAKLIHDGTCVETCLFP